MLKKIKSHLIVAACTAVLVGSAATFVRSADEAKKPSAEEQQKMMEMWMKLAQPGEQHKMLEEHFAGEWTADVKSCSGDPTAPMEESKGTQEARMVLDGRYLTQHFTGKMMDQDYTGMGVIGYDNASKKFISAWIDNMSTGMMNMDGAYDEASKTYTLKGDFNDPSNPNGKSQMREVVKVTDNDHHEMMMYMPGPDGKEMLGMDIKFSRKQ